MIKVAFVCHGNICRSTMAQSVFTNMVNKLGIGDKFIIDSFATSREEIGNPPHHGTVRKLNREGIKVIPHRAKQITFDDYNNFDYIIGMDRTNIINLNKMLQNDPENKIYKLLSFAQYRDDIADPWYNGDFDATYNDVVKGCEGFLKHLENKGIL